jgi:hypothetical protein
VLQKVYIFFVFIPKKGRNVSLLLNLLEIFSWMGPADTHLRP